MGGNSGGGGGGERVVYVQQQPASPPPPPPPILGAAVESRAGGINLGPASAGKTIIEANDTGGTNNMNTGDVIAAAEPFLKADENSSLSPTTISSAMDKVASGGRKSSNRLMPQDSNSGDASSRLRSA